MAAWLQAAAGAYLAFFLLVHVGAILVGRHVLHLDTNFYYAAAGFHVPPVEMFFAPYYFLGIVALFAHLACAFYWQVQAVGRRSRPLLILGPLVLGSAVASLIVLSLAGRFYPIEIPTEYTTPYVNATP